MISYANLDFHFDYPDTKKELAGFSYIWADHFNTIRYTGGWQVISLRSPGGKNTAIPDLNGQKEYRDTDLMEHFPSVRSLLDELLCPVMSVRFLNLKAGSIIKTHRDHDLAFEKGEVRLHLPIFTNPMVEFFIDEERVKMLEGECWYINANLPHRVTNLGTSDRIHLVIDCEVNNWMKGVFARSKMRVKDELIDKEEKLAIIQNLRLQNTAVAIELANNLEKELEHGTGR